MQIDSEHWESANGTYPSIGNKEFYRISESIFKRRILTANKYLSGISKSLARRPAFTVSASPRGYAFMVHTTEGSSRFHGFLERYKNPFPLLYSIDGSSDSNLPFLGDVKVPAGTPMSLVGDPSFNSIISTLCFLDLAPDARASLTKIKIASPSKDIRIEYDIYICFIIAFGKKYHQYNVEETIDDMIVKAVDQLAVFNS